MGETVVRHLWLFIILPVALFVLASSDGRFLTFSSNARVFFGKNNPQLKAMEKLENIYSKDDNVLIAGAPKDGNVFTPPKRQAPRPRSGRYRQFWRNSTRWLA